MCNVKKYEDMFIDFPRQSRLFYCSSPCKLSPEMPKIKLTGTFEIQPRRIVLSKFTLWVSRETRKLNQSAQLFTGKTLTTRVWLSVGCGSFDPALPPRVSRGQVDTSAQSRVSESNGNISVQLSTKVYFAMTPIASIFHQPLKLSTQTAVVFGWTGECAKLSSADCPAPRRPLILILTSYFALFSRMSVTIRLAKSQ